MISPQLPKTAINPELLLDDDNYCVSQKIDGERAVIQAGHLVAYNRSGMHRVLERNLYDSMSAIPHGFTFDGEVVDGTYYVFDLLHVPQGSLVGSPLSLRLGLLERLLKAKNYGMILVPHYFNSQEKRQFFRSALTNNFEGVIFKRLDAPYVEGRSNYFQKVKFTKDVDCIITDSNVGSRDNFVLSVYDEDKLVEIGKVSALTGDGPTLQVGDVVRVTALYATPKLKLYQPVSPIRRTDKMAHECTIDQVIDIVTNKELHE